MTSRPTFDEYFLMMAETASLRSDCERDKVGAVIVNNQRIRSTGYNGAPTGRPGCKSCPRRLSNVAPAVMVVWRGSAARCFPQGQPYTVCGPLSRRTWQRLASSAATTAVRFIGLNTMTLLYPH